MKHKENQRPFVLHKTDVHLWVIPLDIDPQEREKLVTLLSPEEKKRAEKFYFDRDRNRYIVARARLRTLLGQYLSVQPQRLIFGYNVFGKPFLVSPVFRETVQFNLSHSHDWGLIGITTAGPIGVDIEKIKSSIEADTIGKRFFAKGEVEVLSAAPSSKKLDIFFSCWTRKEAFIKAIGKGLTFSLQDFEINPRPEEKYPKLQFLKPSAEGENLWKLFAFEPVDGFKAAVAVRSQKAPVFRVFHFQSTGEAPWKH